jgi:hypothetical protein
VSEPRLPRILGPNLGCPELTSIEALEKGNLSAIIVVGPDDAEGAGYEFRAVPSYAGQGRAFSLKPTESTLLDKDTLPPYFDDVGETRFLISRFLRDSVFKGQARFWKVRLRPDEALDLQYLREVGGARRPTLYDLVLCHDGHPVCQTKHSLCLSVRSPSHPVRFIHLTDLHVAERNDIWEDEVNSTLNAARGASEPLTFINFNERLRRFIREANVLGDAGELDFVLALGDLVDFVLPGFEETATLQNNWQVLIDILTGGGDEVRRGNPGLRVPIFTTLGNHDWRPYPYPPEFNSQLIYSLPAQEAQELDFLYADSSEAAAAKVSEVHAKLVAEGSPILGKSWWGSTVGLGLRWFAVAWHRIWTRSLALAGHYLQLLLATLFVAALGSGGLATRQWGGTQLSQLLANWPVSTSALTAIALILAITILLVLLRLAGDWVNGKLRDKITALLAIQTDVRALTDYFLYINPYFNYAFRLDDCYFLLLDTGYDALTAQSFWDNGVKKLQHLRVRDNIVGGSPESIAFFQPNEYYPYSQIAWLELVLDCIRRSHHQLPGTDRRCRVFAGLHAPPANLSPKDRKKVDALWQRQGTPLLIRPGWRGFDIRYGTLNHYLSEFFYLCLGYRESAMEAPSGPGIDCVLAGHVHWNLEFRLDKPRNSGSAFWNPEVYYGNFSEEVEQQLTPPNRWWGTLLLQTAACGPPSHTQPRTPNFRYITVTKDLGITTLRPRCL